MSALMRPAYSVKNAIGDGVCIVCGGDLPTDHVPTVNAKGAAICDSCAEEFVKNRCRDCGTPIKLSQRRCSHCFALAEGL